MDCSPKCRLAKHADFNFSALINVTPHDEAKVRAILPRFCSNFARVKDQCGRNVLHLAASCGKRDILEWLVKEEGADLDSKDLESGWTSLHRSLFYGYLECVVKLTQVGLEIAILSIIICTYKMCISEGSYSTIKKINKQMNEQTHVWSADEVRYYCTGSIGLCRYRNRFGTENDCGHSPRLFSLH